MLHHAGKMSDKFCLRLHTASASVSVCCSRTVLQHVARFFNSGQWLVCGV